MQLKRYQFRPGLWPSLATLVMLPILLALGFWQLDRADQKAAMQAEFSARYDQPAVALAEAIGHQDADDLRWREVTLTGHFSEPHYLLDNQVFQGDPGYRLYSPLQLAAADGAVLVERDWLPLGADRSQVPQFDTPGGRVELSGRVVPAPATGIMLAEHRIEPLATQLFRVQRIKPAELARHSDLELLPYVVRLHDAAHAEDDQAAALGGFGRERHLGYAFQWFALAATLLLIYLIVNLKKRPTDND
ncbi:surfeit locus 1 family protein [Methylohalomonas lacus]|uniref:SURF1-like protein n=1 Tax=Methylohalomonas lacus TaxID=398773 RepID=A0AAE3HMR3_9GAMM|nr:SURF1 family protein [Methylohalomonas lacus]MCS3903313.1 surfeit locus 1 family protein [Methylohalomonas lacus]